MVEKATFATRWPFSFPRSSIAGGHSIYFLLMNRLNPTPILSRWRTALPYGALLLLSVASRMGSTIYYIEDPDSMRFALGAIDYNVPLLQPHFPGYPVFCFLVKILHLFSGSYALAFSAVGGISVFVIIVALLRMLRLAPGSLNGALLSLIVFANPFIWLMSNRYMPDLMGTACMLAAIWLLLFEKGHHDGHGDKPHGGNRTPLKESSQQRRVIGPAGLGAFLAGLLAGIRLSYVPFVIIPLLVVALRDGKDIIKNGALFLAGILVWLIPLIAITGWNELVGAALMQTTGHFDDFGGTVYTEPQLGRRLLMLLENIIADGMGGYWAMRHWITIAISAGLGAAFVIGLHEIVQTRRTSAAWRAALASLLLYGVWILFFQNVVYQSRHILPILPFLLVPMAGGCAALLRQRRMATTLPIAFVLGAYMTLTAVLVLQHRKPTAIAQATDYVAGQESADLYIASVPLINYFIASQGVSASFLSVHDPGDRKRLGQMPQNARLITIGDYRSLTHRTPRKEQVFYHNPFVNRIWPRVMVHDY